MEFFRTTQLNEQTFTEMWVSRLKKSLRLEENTMPPAEVAIALSAYHEFDFSKLKHRNDLFDAEQLVYLKDPSLHFLAVDRGYLRKITRSPLKAEFTKYPLRFCKMPLAWKAY